MVLATKLFAGRLMTVEQNKQLFIRNLAAIARHSPDVHARIANLKATETNLVFTVDGQADISLGGQLLYGGQSNLQIALPKLTAEWMKLATTYEIGCTDPLRDELEIKLNEYYIKNGIGRTKNPDPPFFHTIIVGIGLGLHVPNIIKSTGCRSLILIEPIAEFFLHSLCVTDWASLIDFFERIGGSIDFIIGQEASASGQAATAVIERYGWTFVDGALCFLHYKTEATLTASEKARAALCKATAFGWFEDEMTMIVNTVANLDKHQWLAYRRPAKPINNLPPVFLIGAGPSFDNAIETIRTHQNRVFIGSCGTALGQLLANGIRPDFHFEIENEHITFKVLETLSSRYDLTGITLVGPSVLDPGVMPLFSERVIFYRPNMSVNPLFNEVGSGAALIMPYPNAANVSTSFFQEIGCREFYYFGIDLGFIDPSHHHSRFSPYMEEGENTYMGNMKLNNGWNFNTTAPANFGGMAHSNEIGVLTRDKLEESFKYFSAGRNYFNCSNGVLINGATPTRPDDVHLPPTLIDKKEAIRRVLAGFPAYQREEFIKAWLRDDWFKRSSARVNELRQALAARENDTPGISLARMLGYMPTRLSKGQGTVEDHVFGGTLALAARAAYTAISRADPPEYRAQVEEFAREEILRILDQMESRYHKILTQISHLVD